MSASATASAVRAGVDTRAQVDRRRRPTPMVSRYLFRGRRRGPRRAAEQEHQYVDRPRHGIIAACLLVLALSTADAYITLRILAQGGSEANPIMAAALRMGHAQFVAVKTALTFFGAAVLCLHQQWALSRAGLRIALAGYAGLLIYHVVMQSIRLWNG